MKIDINKLAEALATSGLSFNQLVVLANLRNQPGCRGPELAALSQVSTATMSQLTGKFLTDGLIKNTSTKTDRRIVEWTLTAKGEKVLDKIQEVQETKKATTKKVESKKVEPVAAEVVA